MKLLCLDLASKTGFAYRDEDAHVESGTVDFQVRRGESRGMQLWRFSDWLDTALAHMGPGDLVLYEMAHHRGGAANEVLTGMATRVMEYAARHGVDYTGVHSSTLKLAVAGKGNASKEEMAFAVARHHRLDGADDNEVDALALLRWYDLGMPESQSRPKRRKVAVA